MNKQRLIISGVILAVLVAGGIVWKMRSDGAVAKGELAHQSAAFCAEQTKKLQPQVESQLKTGIAQVTIEQMESKDGMPTYAVRLPAEKSGDLPKAYAEMYKVLTEARRQGYRGRFILYNGETPVRSLP